MGISSKLSSLKAESSKQRLKTKGQSIKDKGERHTG
jgi:hypothetical protein